VRPVSALAFLTVAAATVPPEAATLPPAAATLPPAAATLPPAAATLPPEVEAVRPDTAGEWRFPVGERATYDVAVSVGSVRAPRPVGTATLAVEAREPVPAPAADPGAGADARADGRRTGDGGARTAYRVAMEIDARIPLVYRMENRRVSWIEPDPVRSLRFEERIREGDYRRDRRYRLRPEEGRYTRLDRDPESGAYRPVPSETDVPMPVDALDEVSFLFFARTLPLEPGNTYRFERFFEEDGNPVVLEVLRRERVRVPAGRFETVVVRPVIRTDGLFSEEGRAEVYFSDDERRRIVQIRSHMKAARVDFLLREYDPGG